MPNPVDRSRPISAEARITPDKFNGSEEIAVSNRINRKYFNWRLVLTDFFTWIIDNIIVPPASLQLQSDWNEADTNSVRYIRNKPTFPVATYVAIITQDGTPNLPPTATVLQNSLSGTPVWTYDSAGIYVCTLANAFPSGKTVFSITGDAEGDGLLFFVDSGVGAPDFFWLVQYTIPLANLDHMNCYLRIDIYP